MTSLRARITILLVAAIVTVVALATIAAIGSMRGPRPEVTMMPLARHIQIMAEMAIRDRDNAIASGIVLRPHEAAGEQLERLSAALTRALQQAGRPRFASMVRNEDGSGFTASVQIGRDEWLHVELPNFAPQNSRITILVGWVLLILIGSIAVAIFAASKITRPLRLLEEAVAAVGHDGVLAPIPETGSAEVRATARALNRLSARLRTAMESRMRLVAAAGHDLRTPMTRMRLRAEFIEDEEERQKWLDDLEELDTIADSAIRLVREEVAAAGSEPAPLDGIVRDIVEELSGLGMRVEAGTVEPLEVIGGPLAIKRALRNLIINAATHGGGAEVEVLRRDQRAVVTIRDNGPDIPPERIDQVFEPFFRVDVARRKSVPGAGLGLAIAREIIERFGGTISVANREPTGLCQTVTFALAETSWNANPAAEHKVPVHSD